MTNNLASFRMYLASCTGNAQNTIYNDMVVINCAEDLAAACLKDHVCTEFKDNRRGSDNFIRCHAIQADCDNDNTEDPAAWITPDMVAARLPGVAFYAVTSRNCGKVKHPGEPGEKSARPRYHYYFPLRVPIPNIIAIRGIMAQLLELLPEFDRDGMKPAQFFYGHADPAARYYPGKQDVAVYLMKHPQKANKVPPAAPAADPEQAAPCAAAAESDVDYLSINVEDMLTAIPADDYGTWQRVGMALKASNLPNAFDLWDRWSQRSGKYKGPEETRRKWQSFKGSGITGGTLDFIARGYGWTPDPARYQEAKHRQYREEHRKEHRAALAAVGIETEDPYRYEWALAFDGSIDTVTDKETGKIVYKKIRPADPAAARPSILNRDDGYRPLKVVSALELNTQEHRKPDYIVDGILYPGLTILAGPPKYGKSYLSLDLACSIATGTEFLGKLTKQGEVLYLDLEGTEWRTTERLAQLGYTRCPDMLDHTYTADTVDQHLIRQLSDHVEAKSGTKLLIIDTMARIKGKVRRGEDGYSSEYRFLFPLHELALQKSVAIVCVTHTRKGNGLLVDDPMELIIGSQAQYGTADNGWVLTGKRDESTKVLHCAGRDYESVDLGIDFKNGKWVPLGNAEEMAEKRAAAEYDHHPAVRTIIHLVETSGGAWHGTMQDLFNEIAEYTGDYPATDATRLASIVRTYIPLLKKKNGILTLLPTKPQTVNGKTMKIYTFKQSGFAD